MSDQGAHKASSPSTEVAGTPVEGGARLPAPAQGDQQVLDLINFLEWLSDKVTVNPDEIPSWMSWEDVAKEYLESRS